jgi:hypothetical protein
MSDDMSPRTIDFSWLFFGHKTPRMAAVTALTFRRLLTTINHGNAILFGRYPTVLKVLLTYCVTERGAAFGKLAQAKRYVREHDAVTHQNAMRS